MVIMLLEKYRLKGAYGDVLLSGCSSFFKKGPKLEAG
jgi:hypothetical protein